MKRYEKYKDSGVEWIGEIPSHWEVCQLKSYCTLKGRIGWNGLRSDEFKETSYAYLVTGQDFNSASIQWEKCYQIDKDRFDEDPYIQLSEGDLLITKDGTIGKIAKVSNLDKPACLNSGIFVMKQRKKVFSQGFLYWLLCSRILKDFNSYTSSGTTILHLYQNVFERMPMIVPLLDEQQSIANYLDAKCGKIDNVIAIQEKRVELLRELKQSIITRAVTRGIPSTSSGQAQAKMKDSGVEWIGEIPEHWEIVKVKHVINLLTDYDANGSFADIANNCNINNGNAYAWMVRATDLENKRYGIVEGNNYCDLATYNYLKKSSLEADDLLIAKRGDIGKSYLVPKCDVPMTLAPNTYLLKTRKDIINNVFFYYYLQSGPGKENLKTLNKSTTLGALYKDDVKGMYIPIPSKDEQDKIVEYLSGEVERMEKTIAKALRQIELLKEYKQSLITEVVTGKRKVC